MEYADVDGEKIIRWFEYEALEEFDRSNIRYWGRTIQSP